jgi:hypothetical protein
MVRRGQPADIQTKVIKVFDEQSSTYDRGGGSELRVIAWIVNGSEKQPQLERREWWMTEDGTKRAGKAKGLTSSDFQFILQHAREIGEALGLPAKIVQQALMTVNEPSANGEKTSDEKTADELATETVDAGATGW